MLRSASIVVVLLLLGDTAANVLSLPVPGAALGMLALSFGFAIAGGPDEGSSELFDLVAPYFPFFFVPSAIGVVKALDILSRTWVEAAVAVFAGTSVVLICVGWVAQTLFERSSARSAT
ncbi:MAG: CidA/LrgA family protein [Pseudomonadota bacterium]